MVKIGLLILVVSWVPLLVVGMLDPSSNPVGLGLLAWGGSLIGIIVAAIGLLLWAVRLARAARSG
jgi:hypothetical protein